MKWRVNNAVTRSTLPPFARLIMFVLANRADTRTAVIPDVHTPSLADIADESGLGLSTVKRHLNILEADGWVCRERPTDEERVRGVRTRYRLAIGTAQSTAHSGPRPTAQSGPSEASEHGSQRAVPGPTEGLGTAQAEPRHGPEWAQSTAQSEPSTYIPIVSDLSDQLRGADAPPADESNALFEAPSDAARQTPADEASDTETEDAAQSAQTLLGEWLDYRGGDRPPARIIGRVGKELKALLEQDRIRFEDVRQGFIDWDTKGADPASMASFVSGATSRRLASERASPAMPGQYGSSSVQRNGYQPYRNPVDQSVYLKGIS